MTDMTAFGHDHLHRLISAATAQSDFETWEGASRELVRRSPKDAEALLSLHNALKAQGLRGPRVEIARRLVGLAPKDARSHAVLGSALAAMGQYDQAVRSYDRAAALAPTDPRVLTALGDVLERVRQNDRARSACERAVAADPRFGPAYNLLGHLDLIDGDLESAERWLDRAIRASPEPEVRSTAWHRLGAIRERQERYDEAFRCHQTANQELAATPVAERMVSRPVFHQLPFQYLPGSEAMIARWGSRKFADRLPDPVFLMGFPRSGTTMTESVLAAMPGTITSDEEPVLTSTMRRALAMCGNPTPADLCGALDTLTDAQIGELRAEYWEEVGRLVSPDARRAPMFVDKTPLRFIHMVYVNLLFPRARVVFIVRDPRDCCLSCYFQHFAMNPVLARFLTLEGTGDTYAAVMAYWLRVRDRVSNPVLEIRYEDMVSDFEAHARRLVDFVGGAWSDDVLRFQEKAATRTIRTPSYRAVTDTVHTRAVGKWSRYEAHIGPLVDRVAPFLGPLGYAR